MIPQKNFVGRPTFRKSPLFSGNGRKKAWFQLFAVLVSIAVTWALSRSNEWSRDILPEKPDDAQLSSDSTPPESPNSSSTFSEHASPDDRNQTVASGKEKDSDRPLGDLKDLGNKVFESAAGLVYKTGSADGHRIDHVLEHGSDEPDKQVHGVYDPGDRAAVLAVIDEAWLKAKKGGSDVRKQKQNQRTVYTIRMNRRIGFVGGKEGKQQNHPECRNIRIVVEGTAEVITAYPVKQF